MKTKLSNSTVSRRTFLKTSAAVSASTLLGAEKLFAAGTEKIPLALIGCGGRGRDAVLDCLAADPATELTAMADLFEDRLKDTLDKLKEKHPERIRVTPQTMFVGFDAYQKALAVPGILLMINAAPPHFRPIHLKAAVEAGIHSFIEKPAGVDPAGIRSVLQTAELARQKGLAIAAGTQRRHQWIYQDMIKRLQDGQIGSIRAAYAYWVGGDMLGYWNWYQRGQMDDIQFQCRNWPWFTWLCGDHIVEQHVHNLDVVNWALNAHPVQAMAIGGRQVRTLGNIYDHFTVDFEYPGGIRVTSMCRQINGGADRIGESFTGADGIAVIDGQTAKIDGSRPYQYEGRLNNPYVQEHIDLIQSIRNGSVLNEGKAVAESTMTGILGRICAYTGRAIRWDWLMNASKLDYTLPKYEFGPRPAEPVAVPGQTNPV